MMTKEEGFHELNIGSGKKTSVEELLEYINEVLGPLDIELEGSTPGDQMGIFSDNRKIKKTEKKSIWLGICSKKYTSEGKILILNTIDKKFLIFSI